MKFFIWGGEQQEGPVDEETIQSMLLQGHITHETLLFPEGGELGWAPAKDLLPQDLFSRHEGDASSAVKTTLACLGLGADRLRARRLVQGPRLLTACTRLARLRR